MRSVRRAVIPVAGQGTRFMPYTKAVPKELLAVLDRPLIHHVVVECLDVGVNEIVLVTSEGKQAIEQYFAPDPALFERLDASGRRRLVQDLERVIDEASLTFVLQGDVNGSGGDVLSAADVVGDEPFLLLWGDELFSGSPSRALQLVSAFERLDGPVIGLQQVEASEVGSYGIVALAEELDDGLVRLADIVEKPDPSVAPSNYAATGGYVMVPDVISALLEVEAHQPGAELHLTDGVRALLGRRDVYGSLLSGRYLDFGNPQCSLRSAVEMAILDPVGGPGFVAFLQARLKCGPRSSNHD